MYTFLLLWSITAWVIHYYMGNCSVMYSIGKEWSSGGKLMIQYRGMLSEFNLFILLPSQQG